MTTQLVRHHKTACSVKQYIWEQDAYTLHEQAAWGQSHVNTERQFALISSQKRLKAL